MMHSLCCESQLLTGEHTCRVKVLQQSCRPWGAVPYTAPEVNLGDDGYGPAVDMWAVGCVLEELVYGRVSVRGDDNLEVVSNVFARFGTPQPPRVLTTLPLYARASINKQAKPETSTHAYYDNVPPIVLAVLKPRTFRSLVSGLVQLAPDARMSSHAAIVHPFFETKLPPVVSDAFAGQRTVEHQGTIIKSEMPKSDDSGDLP